MRVLFLIFTSALLFAGCVSRAPRQPTISEWMERSNQEAEQKADREAKARHDQQDQDRSNYIASHPDLKPPIRDAILNSQVIIGMTEEQAQKSLGGGHDFHSLETAAGRADEWTYQDTHLIFVNGVLTEILR